MKENARAKGWRLYMIGQAVASNNAILIKKRGEMFSAKSLRTDGRLDEIFHKINEKAHFVPKGAKKDK